MERILIVDGSNLLFQMFFGMPVQLVVARTAIIATLSWFNNLYIIDIIMKQEVLRMTLDFVI